MSSMKNPVAKYNHNRPSVHKDKKKSKKRGDRKQKHKENYDE